MVKNGIVNKYNRDIKKYGRYVYTDSQKLSSVIANQRLTDAVINSASFKNKMIIDIGCGDGTYTNIILKETKPKSIIGIDPASDAIIIARKKYKNKNLQFRVANGYKLPFTKNSFDVAVLRGVLHHMDNPRKAINEAVRVADEVIIIEPNGYNIFVKIIEKLSQYHKTHDEKSYFPFYLKKIICQSNARVVKEKYINFVPFFCPDIMARTMKKFEKTVESIPIINSLLCAAYLMVIKKSS
ncbi:class I SAM-dependent methyltransferase [Candidatus Gottesmanbacteria bacterium]|nr:class I SAM-dependent methyltransferase [Candidatus Gottesmanbacteria bacterium]